MNLTEGGNPLTLHKQMKTKGIRKSVGTYKGTKDIRHVECGGEICVGASGTRRLPSGLGFRGDKFVVDYVEHKFYNGFCLECGKEGDFIKSGKGKVITRTPRAINKKLNKN